MVWIVPIVGFYFAAREKDQALFLASLGIFLLLVGLVLIPGFLASEREKRNYENWMEQQREKGAKEVERGVKPPKGYHIYYCSSCEIYIIDKDARFCKHCGDALQEY